jgi:hypothetical protein|tara:strand:+ start:1825 stop:2100 length:276 start_codon:yes stop_codon:yes gene_type:complete
MGKFIQQLIRWMPLILFFLLLMVDRNNIYHVIGYITLLFMYSAVLIMRVLYAKEQWHKDFNPDNIGSKSSIEKMSDLKNEIDLKNAPRSER